MQRWKKTWLCFPLSDLHIHGIVYGARIIQYHYQTSSKLHNWWLNLYSFTKPHSKVLFFITKYKNWPLVKASIYRCTVELMSCLHYTRVISYIMQTGFIYQWVSCCQAWPNLQSIKRFTSILYWLLLCYKVQICQEWLSLCMYVCHEVMNTLCSGTVCKITLT